jgi:hypothetical protein
MVNRRDFSNRDEPSGWTKDDRFSVSETNNTVFAAKRFLFRGITWFIAAIEKLSSLE